MKPVSEDHPLRRLFKGLVDNVFCAEVGICDPAITNYIADLLMAFVHTDQIYRLRSGDGRLLDNLLDMVAQVTDTDGLSADDALRIHRHIGDFALFWSGLYPEMLQLHPGLAGKDHLLDYVAQGKRSYAIAGELANEDNEPSPRLFNRLSAEFEFCCQGLGLVRHSWEEHNPAKARSVSRRLLF